MRDTKQDLLLVNSLSVSLTRDLMQHGELRHACPRRDKILPFLNYGYANPNRDPIVSNRYVAE
jgi:hypothetical protein